MSYTHFTLNERRCLQELLSEGKSFRKIADILGRNVSSVSREVNRNKSKYRPHKGSNNKFLYHAWRAEVLSITRQKNRRHFRLLPNTDEWNYIVDKLNLFWSPEEIAYRWRLDNPDKRPFGVSTVYRYANNNVFEGITPKTHLRRRGKLLMPRSSCYNAVQPDRIIPEWPVEIRERARFGDWEGDTIYGGIGKGLLVTLVDRRSGRLCAGLIEKRNSLLTSAAVVRLLKNLPVNSISFDNGAEFSDFRSVEKSLHTLVYFAEPHKPWQRGTNENTNDMLRFFFPKGFDFRSVSQSDVDFVVDLINNRPRKRLGWKTPLEVFGNYSVALT